MKRQERARAMRAAGTSFADDEDRAGMMLANKVAEEVAEGWRQRGEFITIRNKINQLWDRIATVSTVGPERAIAKILNINQWTVIRERAGYALSTARAEGHDRVYVKKCLVRGTGMSTTLVALPRVTFLHGVCA